jgi:hypothetical protein
MKSFFWAGLVLIMLLWGGSIFADDDDVPYLSDEDIAAMEMDLSDDVPAILRESTEEAAADADRTVEGNEISRLNTSRTVYHLLILDRTYCSADADIAGMNGGEVLYTFRHGTNGYLIAIYSSPGEGPVFPQLPDRSRVIVDVMTVRGATIREYVNSSAFRRFVTSRTILSQIQEALDARL